MKLLLTSTIYFVLKLDHFLSNNLEPKHAFSKFLKNPLGQF